MKALFSISPAINGAGVTVRERVSPHPTTPKYAVPVGFVYAIGGDGYIKIGHTKDTDIRIKQLQTGCPFDLVLLASFECCYPDKIEEFWHRRLRKYKTKGEWFRMPPRVSRKVVQLIRDGNSPPKTEKDDPIQWSGLISECGFCKGRVYYGGWCFACGRRAIDVKRHEEDQEDELVLEQ